MNSILIFFKELLSVFLWVPKTKSLDKLLVSSNIKKNPDFESFFQRKGANQFKRKKYCCGYTNKKLKEYLMRLEQVFLTKIFQILPKIYSELFSEDISFEIRQELLSELLKKFLVGCQKTRQSLQPHLVYHRASLCCLSREKRSNFWRYSWCTLLRNFRHLV